MNVFVSCDLQINVVTDAHVTSLITDEDTGAVIGVRYRKKGEEEDIELPAASVVLTTGGECNT